MNKPPKDIKSPSESLRKSVEISFSLKLQRAINLKSPRDGNRVEEFELGDDQTHLPHKFGHRTVERQKESDDVQRINKKNYSHCLLLPTMVEIESESSSKPSLSASS